MSLEAVLVLKALDDLHLLALDTSIGAVTGDVSIFEQVQPADTHVGEGLRVGAGLGGQVAPGARVRAGRMKALGGGQGGSLAGALAPVLVVTVGRH